MTTSEQLFTVITGAEVFAPQPLGRRDVVVCGGTIAAIGGVDRRALDATGLAIDTIDGTGCVVVPGLIDPHQHLIGGSGESGFHSQTPEVRVSELITAGITTVVGCLGVDATTRTMPALLAKAKGLNHYGITARIYTGGYAVPPATLTGSVRTDVMFIEEVVGAGEIAISDRRSTEPSISELSRLVRDAAAGGLLSGKAGVTHFHLGDEPPGLEPLRALLDQCHIDPALLYPTHLERNPQLMHDGIELTKRGVTIDLDVVEQDLPQMVRLFVDRGGDLERLTASSDASITPPALLFEQARACVRELKMPLERVLPLVTTNTARVLKFDAKGRIATGADADLLVLDARSLDLVAVIARGRVLMKDGRVIVREAWIDRSDRRVCSHGEEGRAAIA